MKLIAHRGNIKGRNINKENDPQYLKEAILKGYEIELDIWYVDDCFFFGHDFAQHKIGNIRQLFKYFDSIENNLCKTLGKTWFHCKNIETLYELLKENVIINKFFHDIDDAICINSKVLWTYPGKKLTPYSIAVMPERVRYNYGELGRCYGICSDYVENYKNMFK